jgi:ketosteroid isomerase-like protein
MLQMLASLVTVSVVAIAAGIPLPTAQNSGSRTPDAVVEELLSADRSFAQAGAKTDLIAALAAMFADDVQMIAPGQFARGRSAAVAALKSAPDNAGARAEWAPIRGGISADGQHGFTVGYMTVHRADATQAFAKYVAYWIKGPRGWRVAVYKRARANAPPSSREMMPPSLPPQLVPATIDSQEVERYRESLADAERAFSDEAQRIGLGAAFANNGRDDSVNVGPPTEPDFVKGAAAIGRAVSGGSTSTDPGLSWGPDRVIVASTGDLGITMGMIQVREPGPDGKPRPPIPFITVWRRASPAERWRYIAE